MIEEFRERNLRQPEFVKKEILPNGLRVLAHEMPYASSVTTQLLVRAGSRYEDKKTGGIAHFLEHMIFEGSIHYPTYHELQNYIEGKGGNIDAFTDKEIVCYKTKFPYEQGNVGMDLLHEIVFNPFLMKNRIKKEREIIISEIKELIETPSDFQWELLIKLLWKDHPLTEWAPGRFESLKNITRNDLIQYHKRFYTPDNSLLVVAGNISANEVIAQAYATFGNLSGTVKLPQVSPPVEQHIDSSHVYIDSRFGDMNAILLGFSTKGRGESNSKAKQIDILTEILSRRIQHRASQTGLSYSAEGTSWLFSDCGVFGISVDVVGTKIEMAIKELVRDINRLTIDEQTLAEAKTAVVTDELLDLDSTENYADFIRDQEFYTGKVLSPNAMKQQIQSITLEEIQALQKELLTIDNAAMIILGSPSPSERNIRKYERLLRPIR